MGKSWKANACNPKWRKAKLERERQRNGGRPQTHDEEIEELLRRDEKNGLYGGVEDVAN